MTEQDSRLSWHTLPMVDDITARRLLDRTDDLGQVVLCLKLIYRSFARVVEASQRLETETGVDADELRGLIAYRIEHAGRWLERLEERLPAVSVEFAGASARKAVRFLGIKAASHVVVAAKLARATLANAELVARGEPTRPFVELCSETPPVLHRAQILARVPALAGWSRQHLATVPAQDLFRDIEIELANAWRARDGSALIKPQVRRAFDEDGVLTETAAKLLNAVKQLNERGESRPGHKAVARLSKLGGDTSRAYLHVFEELGLLAADPDLQWKLTTAAHDHLVRYESKRPAS